MVLCSGCFDGLHAGHVAYLATAKALCGTNESLTVVVATDEEVERQKGQRPRRDVGDRLLVVSALRMVDRAWAGSAIEGVVACAPRLFVKGSDWQGLLPDDLTKKCDEVDCRIIFVPTQGTHNSELT